MVCINFSVEESQLSQHLLPNGSQLEHDKVVRRSMKPEDVLVVHLGGNDILPDRTVNVPRIVALMNGENFSSNYKEETKTFMQSEKLIHLKNGKHQSHLTYREAIKQHVESFLADSATAAPGSVLLLAPYFPAFPTSEDWSYGGLQAMQYDDAKHPDYLKELIRNIHAINVEVAKELDDKYPNTHIVPVAM